MIYLFFGQLTIVFFACRLSKAADLDHHWVAKAWLSDVGLPQYSQAFHNHLVDGRMLNSLTRHDLERHLNITKKFHQISLLLGIELLQLLQFDKEVRKNVTRNRLHVREDFSVMSSYLTSRPCRPVGYSVSTKMWIRWFGRLIASSSGSETLI